MGMLLTLSHLDHRVVSCWGSLGLYSSIKRHKQHNWCSDSYVRENVLSSPDNVECIIVRLLGILQKVHSN